MDDWYADQHIFQQGLYVLERTHIGATTRGKKKISGAHQVHLKGDQRDVQQADDEKIERGSKLISSWMKILRTCRNVLRTGIKQQYRDFSWLLNCLNILIKIIGISIHSSIALHSNPDFPVDTSVIPALYHQKFSWFQRYQISCNNSHL